jgi:hypothetical protein
MARRKTAVPRPNVTRVNDEIEEEKEEEEDVDDEDQEDEEEEEEEHEEEEEEEARPTKRRRKETSRKARKEKKKTKAKKTKNAKKRSKRYRESSSDSSDDSSSDDNTSDDSTDKRDEFMEALHTVMRLVPRDWPAKASAFRRVLDDFSQDLSTTKATTWMKNEAAFITEVMFDLHKANRKHVEKVSESMAACNRLFHRVSSMYVRARGGDEQLYLDELSKALSSGASKDAEDRPRPT